MKFFLTNLALFVLFAVVFSSWSACGGSAANTATSGNTAAPNANTAAPVDPSTYPPLVSGIATAEIEFADGTKGTLADRKGKVVLINLWGIWCGPCRAEMPHLVELQDKYRDKGFQVIGLNVGNEDFLPESFENIKAFGEKTKLNYELARGPRELQSQIYHLAGFDGVPVSLLIDREGRLRAVLRGGGPAVVTQMKESVAKAMADGS
jgi:thiol-disulfide isomerase/thioredoxin